MPEIFRELGFRFYFYSDEHLPIHVHVRNADGEIKLNIVHEKITIIRNYGMKLKDVKIAKELAKTRREEIIMEWIKFFG